VVVCQRPEYGEYPLVSEPQDIGKFAERTLRRIERPSLVAIELAQFRQQTPSGTQA